MATEPLFQAAELDKTQGLFLAAAVRAAKSADTVMTEVEVNSSASSMTEGDDHQLRVPATLKTCVHDLVREQSVRQPQKIAIHSSARDLTYADLEHHAGRLAWRLIQAGIQPGQMVPFCLKKSIWTAVTMLAILKAGAACVALDPSHSVTRIERILQDTNASLVLVHRKYLGLFDGLGVPIMVLDSELWDMPAQEKPELLQTVDAALPAYVAFTSGSTGEPKGIIIPHQAITTSMQEHGPATWVSPETRALQFASYTFDMSFQEMFTTLTHGGCVCVPSEHEQWNDLAGTMERLGVNWAKLIPTVVRFLHPAQVPSLQTLVVGGEPITRDIIETWAERVRLIVSYGPAEASIMAAASAALLRTAAPHVIGRPVGGALHIVDPDNHERLLEGAVEGELLIEGPTLAAGYLKDPFRTEASFITAPAWIPSGAGVKRVYKTGDLVRRDEDGLFYHLGRKDSRIKVNGKIADLAAIETCLLSSGLIVSAVVIAPGEETNWPGSLVAVVAARSKSAAEAPCDRAGAIRICVERDIVARLVQELRTVAQASLLEHMVPVAWVVVDHIPRLPSGKTHRREVALWLKTLNVFTIQQLRMMHDITPHREPETPVESRLREIWAAVLNMPVTQLSTAASFTALGGDSVTAMKLARACTANGLGLNVQTILQNLSIADIAPKVTALGGKPTTNRQLTALNTSISLEQLHASLPTRLRSWAGLDDVQDFYRCSPIQEGILLRRLRSTGDYDVRWIAEVAMFDCGTRLSLPRLQDAWVEVVQRHPALRTFFVEDSSQESILMQVVLRSFRPMISVDTTRATIDEIVATDAAFREPLHNEPHRLTLLALPTGQVFMRLELSHALSDGASTALIFRDLSLAYSGNLLSHRAPGFGDVVRQLRLGEPGTRSSANIYWTAHLTGMEPCLFPVLTEIGGDGPVLRDIAVPIHSGHKQLVGFCAQHGVTIANVFHTAWAIVLGLYTRMNDVSFGYLVSGRDAPVDDVEEVVGPLISLMIHRLRLSRSSTPLSALKQVQSDFAQGFPHQHCSLAQIAHSLGFRGSPLFNTVVNVQRRFSHGVLSPLTEVHIRGLHCHNPTEFALALDVEDWGNEVTARLSYWLSYVSPIQVEGIVDTLTQVLQNILDDPLQTIGEMPLLGERFRTKLSAWNSALPAAKEACLPELIEKKFRAQPSAVAIDTNLGHITYQDLWLQSGQLALRMMRSGIRPGELVPVCFHKSSWAIIAMLAIQRAGAAFVPLDPNAHGKQWKEIVSQSRASVVVTSQAQKDIISAQLPELRIVVADADGAGRGLSNDPEQCLPTISAGDTAYVIFTSGSTGVPKGIVVPHRAISSSLCAHCPVLGIGQETRALQFAAYTFDASIQEIFGVLIHGGCVCVPSEETKMNDLVGFINSQKVNWTFFTPSLIRLINPDLVPSLKTVVLGGEAIVDDNINTWSHRIHLINGYGPAECCICCVVADLLPNQHQSPSTIGWPVGCRGWVVDPQNYNRLLPADCVGELLIEGNIVAKGYLRDPDRTVDSFLPAPQFLKFLSLESPADSFRRCFYRTGDLVRQNQDGSLVYVGRSDTQTKVNGQRIEIGEIESKLAKHTSRNQHVLSSVVLVPKSGLWQKRLVGVLSFGPGTSTVGGLADLALCDERPKTTAAIQAVLRGIESVLLQFMVPTVWIPVRALPTLASGKINRRNIQTWVESPDLEIFNAVSRINTEAFTSSLEPHREATSTETLIRTIWSRVLSLPADLIRLDHTFLSLGGDSISAMQVVYQAHLENLRIGVKDVLRCKTITDLAHYEEQLSEPVGGPNLTHLQDDADTPFVLSPIQRWFFDSVPNRPDSLNHYNQSLQLLVINEIDHHIVKLALDYVVGRHVMLQSRFLLDGWTWKQKITSDIEGSFCFQIDRVDTVDGLKAVCQRSQKKIDILNGPLLVADFVDVSDTSQCYLLLVCHHLVMDVVSWSIIHRDLEAFLAFSHAGASLSSTSFQTWARLQSEPNTLPADHQKALPFNVLPADMGYWGLSDVANEYRHGETINLTIGKDSTSALFSGANIALRTEPVELIMAAVLYSFGRVFHDRPIPALYTEGHGREGDQFGVDLSGTVGWFTTICPLQLEEDVRSNWACTVAQVKDRRRSIPAKGWAYFSCRNLSSEGRAAFDNHRQMEILFNFTGTSEQLGEYSGLLRPYPLFEDSRSDFDPHTPRGTVFAIESSVVNGKLQVSLNYHRSVLNVNRVKQWTDELRRTLADGVQTLIRMERQLTLTDCPLVTLDYAALDSLSAQISQLQTGSAVEEVYPCSPIQEGILLSSMKNPGQYQVKWLVEVVPRDGLPVSVQQLEEAWRSVVRRHSILRTVFFEDPSGAASFLQVVLENPRYIIPTIAVQNRESLSCIDDEVTDFTVAQLPYQVTFYQLASGAVFFRLNVSHAILDGASMTILAHDLVDAYDCCLPKDGAPLYREYIVFLQGVSQADTLSYWKAYLEGVEPCRIVARRKDLESSTAKEVRKLPVQLPTAKQLKQFCRAHELTITNIMQAVWAALLMYYAGSEAVCFGFLSSGRDVPIPSVDRAAGPFINILPCFVRLSQNSRLLDIVKAVQSDNYRHLAHEHCSLGQIHQELGLKGTVLFNTLVNFQRLTAASHEASVSLTTVASRDPSEYDLAFNVTDQGGSITAELVFWSSFMDDTDAHDLSSAVSKIFDDFIQFPEAILHDLSPVAKGDVERIASLMPAPAAAEQQCVHWLIEQSVEKAPHAPAVCSSELNLTYAELDQEATSLGQRLCREGVCRNDMVAICMEKSPWVVVAMLAILKVGAAFVPLDPSHPKSRRESLIHCVDARVALISQAEAEGAHAGFSGCRTIRVGSSRSKSIENGPVAFSRTSPEDPAYVLFTSGSTGKPKGVIVPHRAVCTSLKACSGVMNIGPQTRSLQFAAYTFDAAIGEIFGILMNGGCVCVPSELERLNFLPDIITRLRANWAFATPSIIRQMKPSSVRTLRTLVVGGEALSRDVFEVWSESVDLIQAYGPTETCVFSHAIPIVSYSQEPSLIGPGTWSRSWVVSPFNCDTLVPRSCIGELVIEGWGVTAGYLNNPEQTAAAFLTEPQWWTLIQDRLSDVGASTGPSEAPRFYRTGDLVSQNIDGSITYLGRRDTQTKVNGQRIELGEVEYHLSCHPAVLHAITAVPKEGSCRSRLVAVISLDPNLEPSLAEAVPPEVIQLELVEPSIATRYANELIRDLQQKLPTFMVPAICLITHQLPLQSSGKIDRRRIMTWLTKLSNETLREILQDDSSQEESPIKATPAEEHMREIWSLVLNLPVSQISLNQSFFNLGGDSITAMQVVANCRRIGIQVTVQDLLRWKTILQIMPRATRLKQTTGSLAVPSLSRMQAYETDKLNKKLEAAGQPGVSNVSGVYACSPMQEGILLAALKSPGKYEVILMLEIRSRDAESRIDLDKLESAWLQVVDRHDILRTVFTQENSAERLFSQIVLRNIDPTVQRASLDSPDALGKTLCSIGHMDCIPHRLTLCQTPGSTVYVKLEISHAVVDGWSLSVLSRDLQQAYDGQLAAQPAPQYRELIGHLESISNETSMNFWKGALRGVVPCLFPQVPSDTGADTAKGLELHQTRLRISRTRELRGFCAAHDITVANVVQLAWALTLHRYTGMVDICFGYLVSGRDAPIDNVQDALGPYINMLIARANVGLGHSVKKLLCEMKDSFLGMSAHQHTSLTEIQHELGLSGQNLFNTVVNVQRRDPRQQDLHSSIEIHELESRDPSEFGISLNVNDAGSALEVGLAYWSSLLTKETGDDVGFFIDHLVSAMLDHSDFSAEVVAKMAIDRSQKKPSDTDGRKSLQAVTSSMSDSLAIHSRPRPQILKKEPARAASVAAYIIQRVWAEVVGLPISSVDLDETFLSIGGDSLLAMKAVAQCRELHSVEITVQHILQNKTLRELSELARFSDAFSYAQLARTPEPVDTPFPLSPIQRLHFQLMPTGQNYYNQSFFFRLTEYIDSKAIEKAVHMLVQRHSILRARFNQNSDDTWTQRISPDAGGSYYVSTVTLDSLDQAKQKSLAAQTTIDIRNGPLLSVTVFQIPEQIQYLYLVAHHLVVDLVSWRILLADLEILLRHGEFSDDQPFPFQTWNRLAADYVQNNIDPTETLPFRVNAADYGYWGMANLPNLTKDTATLEFSLPADITSYVLGASNASLGTEPTDLMIAALSHTFSSVFKDHPGATLFQESHGREPWTSDIDLSGTCGWFTVLSPLSVGADLVDFRHTLKLVKDQRRRIPGKGWPYFASHSDFSDSTPGTDCERNDVEMLFNYVGLYQQFSHKNALFRRAGSDVRLSPDFSPDSARLALIEINVLVDEQGQMVFHLTYNRRMTRQDGLTTWVERCRHLLFQEMPQLLTVPPERTPSDFPLLDLSYKDLDALERHCQEQFGCGLKDVEDMYPCSPMQEGIILSQIRDPSLYQVKWTAEISSTGENLIDLKRLKQAWKQVVRRHPILRTMFIERHHNSGVFSQLVLDHGLVASLGDNEVEDKVLRRMPYRVTFNSLPDLDTITVTLRANHAIIDGATIGILARDLGAAYGGQLPEASGPLFGDFIKSLQALPMERNLDYWLNFLSSSQTTLFPRLHGKPDKHSLAGENQFVEKEISFADGARIHEFCATFGVTVLNLFQVAWALVLRLYTGQDDVCFGYLASGRDSILAGVNDIAGPMINMLVCRLCVTDNTTPRALLKQAHRNFTQALSHQHVPLAEVQHRLDTDGIRLFNTLVNLQRANVGDGVPDLKITTTSASDLSEYAVAIQIADSGKHVELLLGHWLSQVSLEEAELLASLVSSTVDAIMTRPRARLETVNLCNDMHTRKMLEWNDAASKPALESTLHAIVQEQAMQHPDAVAIASTDAIWTYGELERAAHHTALQLLSQGVQPGTILPFCMKKSPGAIIVMLAILKVGCACAALDPTHPPERLREIVQQADAHFVVTEPEAMSRLQLDGAQCIIYGPHLHNPRSPDSAPRRLPSVSFMDAAFIIFTSGSTGKPKGIVLQHNSICTSIRFNGEAELVTSSTRGLQFASFTFDTSVDEIFTVLSCGGCVCVPTESERMNGLTQFLRRFEVNWLSITPTVARLVPPAEVPMVKTIILGGEAICPDVVEQWADHTTLVASYGPAEASIACAASPLTAPLGDPLLGRPVASSLWVVHPASPDSLMPIGAAGELVIGGPLLAREYLNDPERTANAFFVEPKWSLMLNLPHKRFYKSGDMARWNADGTLTYLGRLDSQVKLNGQRVELGEVEQQLQLHAGVQYSMCTVPQSGVMANRLLGIISVSLPQIAPTDDLRPVEGPQAIAVSQLAFDAENALLTKLPRYMVPTVWVSVEALPLNASGKLDRRRVTQWLEDLQDEDSMDNFLLGGLDRVTEDEAFLSPMQKTIRRIWGDVLGRSPEKLGLQQSFFALGGDSVAAMRVVSGCRDAQLQLTVQDVFQKQTIQQLAACARPLDEEIGYQVADLPEEVRKEDLIRRLATLKADILQPLGGAENVEDLYQCSPMQDGILYSRSGVGGSYDSRLVVEVVPQGDNVVSHDRLERAWADVVQRHPILRTIIVDSPSEEISFAQLSLRKYRPTIRRTRLSNRSLDEILAHASQPLDDRKEPPHHLTICEISQQRVILILNISHVLTDAVSLDIIWKDLQLAYDGLLATEGAPLYSTFISYLRSRPQKDRITYWTEYLKGSEPCLFPVLGVGNQQRATRTVPVVLSVATNDLIREFCSSLHITVAHLFQATWSLVLRAYVGADDVSFGYISSGRDLPLSNIDSLVGPLISMMVSCIRYKPTMTLAGVLKQVRHDSVAGMANQHCSLATIYREAGLKSKRLFNTLLTVVRQQGSHSTGSSIQLNQIAGSAGSSEFDVVLEVNDLGVTLDTTLAYSESALSPYDAASLSTVIVRVLEWVLSHRDSPVDQLNVCSDGHLAQMRAWNSATCSSEVSQCLDGLLSLQAHRRPTSPALWTSHKIMTYAELDSKSTVLARHLMFSGIGSGSMVLICLPKSMAAIVAMIAIMKARGAFVPLDPLHPPQRLADLARKTGAKLILSSSDTRAQAESVAARYPCSMVDVESLLGHSAKEFQRHTACPPSDPRSVAYVLFTSGSTGTPKGVVVPHTAVCSSIRAHSQAMNIDAMTRSLQFSSYTFDACICEIFSVLVAGGTVCIPSDDERVHDIGSFITRSQANWAFLTPTVIRSLALAPSEVPSLKTLVLGGEAVSVHDIQNWVDHVSLFNGYGPTETCVFCVCNPILSKDQSTRCIGRPIGCSAWVVSAVNHDMLLPPGCPGELLIEGPIVSHGYLNDVDRTGEAFVIDPLWSISRKPCHERSAPRRFYKTGDLVRQLSDGTLEYLGRLDSQVKVSGQRLDLREIEHQIKRVLPDDFHVYLDLVRPPNRRMKRQY